MSRLETPSQLNALCPRARFEQQARMHPTKVAIRAGDAELAYASLNRDANRIARYLSDRGARSESLILLLLDETPDLVVCALGTMKCLGAYLYVDSHTPAKKIRSIIEDAEPELIVTTRQRAADLNLVGQEVILLEDVSLEVASFPGDPLPEYAELSALSAAEYREEDGKLVGEMIELHELMSRFDSSADGMDGVQSWASGAAPSAATLEGLLTPLTLGNTIEFEEKREAVTADANRTMEFSLYFFASHEGASDAPDKYKLILDAAHYADANGFAAVWSPERHFHAFGGLSPNPSVMSAALARETERVQIRSGSVVTPLHHPIRIAEEWSLVDNLSGGRVGLGVASGWFPNDFVMAKDRYDNRKDVMFEDIETLRRLWKGESLPFENPLGDTVDIHIVPQPIQQTLPLWITAAVNPDTFRRAGELGTNVLTHLLGQSLEQLEENIRIYREAWQEAGHEGRGMISLMLHTFVGESDEEVLDLVREPMKRYLASSVNLVANYIKSLPIYKNNLDIDVSHLSAEEVDAILEHSFRRYFDQCGLFGTAQTCIAQVDRFKELDVDDLACLVDFGLPREVVMNSLPRLRTVMRNSNVDPASVPQVPQPVVEVTEEKTETPVSSEENELERTLKGIWCEVLSNDEFTIDDNFFDLGGHSLLTVRVQSALEDQLDLKVPLTALFRYPTVRSLAAHLSGDGEGRSDAAARRANKRKTARRRRHAR